MKGYRVAVVAPVSPLGRRIREVLKERHFPITELKLFEGVSPGEARLTEFEGDIVVTQPPDPDLFTRLDLLFFAEDTKPAHVEAAVERGVVTFVFREFGIPGSPGPKAALVALGVNDKSLPAGARLVRTPQPAAALLGTVLSALGQDFTIASACATLMLPALELGKEGLEELHQQTVSVLSFKSPPTRVFREQLAFNLTLATPHGESPVSEERVGRDAVTLSGQEFPLAVSLLRAPLFTGYALSLWVELRDAPETGAVAQALRASKRLHLHETETAAKPAPSPLSVATLERIHVGRLRADAGGFWMWVVADTNAVDQAIQSVRLAEKLLDVPRRKQASL